MAEGKRSFLEQSDWLVIPWEKVEKPRIEKLLDVGCMLPGLVEDRRSLSVQKQTLAQEVLDNGHRTQPILEQAYHFVASALARRCEQLLHQIRMWKVEWEMQGNIFDHSKTSHLPPCPAYPHTIFGPPFIFCNLLQANLYAMYNSILATLLTITYEVKYEASPLSTDLQSNAIFESLLLKPGIATPPTDNEGLLMQRHQSAVEICRSTPYHHWREKHGSGASYMIMFPLLVALQVVTPSGDEARYINSVIQCFAEAMGFGNWPHGYATFGYFSRQSDSS